jgi:hypothetical protein
MTKIGIAAAAAVLGVLGLGPQQAEARIVCDGVFQIVQGQPIATPYCESQNLARVARSYGMRVTAESIRKSESTKASVCQAIGQDNRVRSACQGYFNQGGGGRFRR